MCTLSVLFEFFQELQSSVIFMTFTEPHLQRYFQNCLGLDYVSNTQYLGNIYGNKLLVETLLEKTSADLSLEFSSNS